MPTVSYGIVGTTSSGGGGIGQDYIDYAANLDLGRTVGFLQYGDGTATGTLVPSTVFGTLKFLTAAHNVDSNNDGILDAGLAGLVIYFGNAPGNNGTGATYSVTATAAQIAVNPLWAASGGSASNDIAVISFTVSQITTVNGGASTLQASAVSAVSPAGLEGRLAGHGLHSDGTVNLSGENPEDGINPPGNAVNDVNGILKGGTNVIDFVGVPGNVAPPTISPVSGNVILVDFDKPDGTTSTFGGTAGTTREAGTAKGDSGSALFADTNGDGKYEVVGVLNGGDNPYPGGASAFGDVSQFAAVLTTTNLAFLISQGVFVGNSIAGFSAGDFGGLGFAVVDLAGINNFYANAVAAQQFQSFASQAISPHLSGIQTHVNRIQRATSRLENVGGDEVTLADLAGFGSRRWEIWTAGNLGGTDVANNSTANGPDTRFTASTMGVDFLATSHVIVGATWSYLTGKGSSSFSNMSMDSSGNAVGFNISGNWGGLNSSLIYSYAHLNTGIEHTVGGTPAYASPDVSAHTLDWTLSYNLRQGGWVHGPTAGLRYTDGRIGGYTESSSVPVAGLASVSSQQFNAFRMNVGYNVAYHIPVSSGLIVPFFSAAWIHQTLHSRSATAAYQGSPFYVIGGSNLIPVGSGPTSRVSGLNQSSSFASLQAGIELISRRGFSVTLQGFLNVFRQDLVEGGGGLQMGLVF